MMTISELKHHIAYCRLNEKDSQKRIYNSYYNQARLICEQYTEDHQELTAIIKQGFQKMFNQISHFNPEPKNWISSFDSWLRKIMIYSAIDHLRKHYRKDLFLELDTAIIAASIKMESNKDKVSMSEIQKAIMKLSPADRTFLKLALIEKLDFHDIAECLDISVQIAEANFLRTGNRLRELLSGFSSPLMPGNSTKKIFSSR
jgi:RNA polymerase sigma-70 factor (ECF subfamily)